MNLMMLYTTLARSFVVKLAGKHTSPSQQSLSRAISPEPAKIGKEWLKMKVYCGECEHYQGDERVPNPKSAFHLHAWRVKCAIGKSKTYVGDSTTLPDSHYQCSFYVPSKKAKERTEKTKAEIDAWLKQEVKNSFSEPIEPTKMTEAAKWHNDYCGKLNGKRRCDCACGWAKVDRMSWIKFIGIYGWWKAIKAEVL